MIIFYYQCIIDLINYIYFFDKLFVFIDCVHIHVYIQKRKEFQHISIFYIFQKIKIIPFLNGILYIYIENIYIYILHHIKRYIRIYSWDMQWLSIFYEIKNEKNILNILSYGHGLFKKINK